MTPQGTQPFTNFYPIGGGGKVVADPKMKLIKNGERLDYSVHEADILKKTEKSEPSDSSWDYGAGPIATLSSA